MLYITCQLKDLAILPQILERLEMTFLANLISTRNIYGELPSEIIKATLNAKQVKNPDPFKEYSGVEVDCLLKLKKQTNASAEEQLHTAFSCTCGQCLGALSPRMRYALEHQASIIQGIILLKEVDGSWLDKS